MKYPPFKKSLLTNLTHCKISFTELFGLEWPVQGISSEFTGLVPSDIPLLVVVFQVLILSLPEQISVVHVEKEPGSSSYVPGDTVLLSSRHSDVSLSFLVFIQYGIEDK